MHAAERAQSGLPPSLAIENAGSGEKGKALLEEALSDEDEVVRAVARAPLEPDGLEGHPLGPSAGIK